MGNAETIARVNRAIAAVAAQQHGVVSRQQLRQLGLTDRTITQRAKSGRLHPVGRGVFSVGHGRIGRHGQMLAAVLACGRWAVVSHGTAAELLGLWDKKGAAVDLIAAGQSGRRVHGIRGHFVPMPEDDEVDVWNGVPCTTASRTLVDLAGVLSEKSLRRLVEQAATLRLLDLQAVDRALQRGRRRGAPGLRAVLADWRTEDEQLPRLRSPLEARLFAALNRAGLPLPQCNVRLLVDGHRFEIDFLWQVQRLVIETDGQLSHHTTAAFHRDRFRDQVLAAAGYRTARVTWDQMEAEPQAVISRIRRMLGG